MLSLLGGHKAYFAVDLMAWRFMNIVGCSSIFEFHHQERFRAKNIMEKR